MPAVPPAEDPSASFTEWLRGRSDTALVDLLGARPDLARPVPADITVLAARALAPSSLRRALDDLDAFALQVLGQLAAGDTNSAAGDPAAVTDALQRLATRALVCGASPQLRPAPGVVELLAAGPSDTAAAVPVTTHPPEPRLIQRDPAAHDRLGAIAVLECLRLIAALAETWSHTPPSGLRTGGVGVRDLRRTAEALDLDEPSAVVLIEVAAAAGLINSTVGVDPVYLPTADYDAWSERPPAARWSRLAGAWLAMTRQPSLVGQRGEHGRGAAPLSRDVERGTAPALRRVLLDELSTLPPGSAPTTHDEILRRLHWLMPRRSATRASWYAAMLGQADLLGITAAGGLTGYSRTLWAGNREVAEQVLTDALPEPVDHFVTQPDLTAVVPGPPTDTLASMLRVCADLESTGGAHVYRFTPASIRRALDTGHEPEQLTAFVHRHSHTPVPQALEYLITDAARRHGRLRVGAASSYLRCTEESLLVRVLGERELASAQLHRVGTEVLVSPLPPTRLLQLLRAAGYAPAAESARGEVITLAVQAPRAPNLPPPRPTHARRVSDDARTLAALVGQIRRGGAAVTPAPGHAAMGIPVPAGMSAPAAMPMPTGQADTSAGTGAAGPATQTTSLLREAIRGEYRLRLGCSDADGTVSRQLIVPYSLAAGVLRGRAPTGELRSFPVHRITAVEVLTGDSGDDDADNDGADGADGADTDPGLR